MSVTHFLGFIYTLLLWTMVGLAIWQIPLSKTDVEWWILIIGMAWILNLAWMSPIFKGVKMVTLSEMTTILEAAYTAMPNKPYVKLETYHYERTAPHAHMCRKTHTSNRPYDVDITDVTTAVTISTSTPTIISGTSSNGGILAAPPHIRYLAVDVRKYWMYDGGNSIDNARAQVRSYINDVKHLDAHTRTQIVQDPNYTYTATAAPGIWASQAAPKQEYLVALKGSPPSYWVLWALLGLGWFYVEWLRRATESRNINILKALTFAPVSPPEMSPEEEALTEVKLHVTANTCSCFACEERAREV